MGIAGRIAGAFLESRLTPLLTAAALGLGVMAVLATPREEEPQISVPMIDVLLALPGASPQETETPTPTPTPKPKPPLLTSGKVTRLGPKSLRRNTKRSSAMTFTSNWLTTAQKTAAASFANSRHSQRSSR